MPCRAWEAHRSWWTCSAPAKIAQPPKTHSALKYKAKRGFLQATPSVKCCLHTHPEQQDAREYKMPEEATGQTHYPRTYLVTNSGRQRLAAISAAAAASLLCAGCVHSSHFRTKSRPRQCCKVDCSSPCAPGFHSELPLPHPVYAHTGWRPLDLHSWQQFAPLSTSGGPQISNTDSSKTYCDNAMPGRVQVWVILHC